MLSGYKTYIIVGLTVACTLVENFGVGDIPGFTPSPDWLTQILAMLGIGALRAGVAGK